MAMMQRLFPGKSSNGVSTGHSEAIRDPWGWDLGAGCCGCCPLDAAEAQHPETKPVWSEGGTQDNGPRPMPDYKATTWNLWDADRLWGESWGIPSPVVGLQWGPQHSLHTKPCVPSKAPSPPQQSGCVPCRSLFLKIK